MVAVVIVVACALIVDADPVAVAVNENATSLQVPSVRQSLQPWLLLLLLVMMMQVLTYVSVYKHSMQLHHASEQKWNTI